MKTQNKKSIQVTEIKGRPDTNQKFSMIQCGIRTKEGVERWAEKYGLTQVYWNKADEKVYGVKSIADQAKEIEEKSELVLEQVAQMEMAL